MGFSDDVKAAAEQISDAPEITIISHTDADGISCEAILSQAISRQGISVKSVFVRQLEPLTMSQVPSDNTLKVFSDLGAGQQNLFLERGFSEKEVLIVDHHVSQPCERQYNQVNCLPYGYERMSAAGVSYLIAKQLDSTNTDLAKLAIIGNVGDMMAREKCGLVGPARDIIVEDGVRYGNVEVRKHDLNCYGTATRPLHLSLAYNDDPFFRGISDNPEGARQFLKELGIRQQTENGRWYVREEISRQEKRIICSALAELLIANGEKVDRLITETYGFPDETPRTPLRNAQEYATVLNACWRWAKPQIGSAILRGDRGTAYRDAEHMLKNHRAIIRNLLEFIIDTGVKELENLQYLHVGGRYPDTIIGIGAGMALSKLNAKKPILIMCEVPEDTNLTKVSMRTNERVVEQGIDLQQALNCASAEYGGWGGGHKIAAGAYIPKTAEAEFVIRVNRILGEQFAAAGSRYPKTQKYRDIALQQQKINLNEDRISIIQPPKEPESSRNSHPAKQLPPEFSYQYTESELIGKGGFASVFAAKRKDGRRVAVKIPSSLDAATGKTFIAEIQNWTKLDHPNIVRVSDYNILPVPYFEMELCDSSLADRKKPLKNEEAAWVLFNVCKGLKFTHARKIIHRDLKPLNILLKKGMPKISDWGLSRVLSESASTSAMAFTPMYAAPEQISSQQKDERTDIWQLGVIFYELVTGKYPFIGDSILDIMTAIVSKNPTPPSVICPPSRDVEAMIMKCLKKNPDRRYQSVNELQKDLAWYLKGIFADPSKEFLLNDMRDTVFYYGDFVLVNILCGDLKSAHNFLLDHIKYANPAEKEKAMILSEQIKMKIDAGIPEISDEFIQKAEMILYQVSEGIGNSEESNIGTIFYRQNIHLT